MSGEADVPFEPEAERIARELRRQIIDGERLPGSRLVEREIAAEMGVSRIPVRDALKKIVAEGLATARPHSWAVVREFTERDIDELIEVRYALETLAFRLAAESADADGVKSLAEALERQRHAARKGDAVEARHAAADFHAVVTQLANNRLLDELFQVTDSRMRWLLSQHDDLEAMLAEHERLYDAVASGDGTIAAHLAGKHVRSSRMTAVDKVSRS